MLGVGGQRNSTGEPPPRWEIEHYESNVPSLPGKFLAPYLDGKICGSKLLKTVIMGHRQRDAPPPRARRPGCPWYDSIVCTAQLICNEAIIAVVNREKQPSHAVYSSAMLWCALRILRALGNRQFALLGKYYRWQFSGVNIAIVKSEHSYFFFVITIKAEAYTLCVACSHIFLCNVECYLSN